MRAARIAPGTLGADGRAIGGAMAQTELAHTIGVTEPPLLEQTIGENFAATVAAHPDREALVVAHQDVRLTYRRAVRSGR